MRIRKFAKYYLTSEVAELLNIHTDTVKRWGDEGVFGTIGRAPVSGWRLFPKEHVQKVLRMLQGKEIV